MTIERMNDQELELSGYDMHKWAVDLFPICRSIAGEGVRDTLGYIKTLIPELVIYNVESGKKVFDWEVPNEWSVKDAYIEDEDGNRVVDFKYNNLHLVSHSEPVDLIIGRDELNGYLHSLPELPDAIPYVTSYYQKSWGFCLSENQRKTLQRDKYHVFIDSELKPGFLNYGELLIPGGSDKEVLISTYICHPSMANNELSGPVVVTALVRWLLSQNERRFTYRIIFAPETIGSIIYIQENLAHLKKKVIAGFNITCAGDDRCYSYLESRYGNTYADQVAKYALQTYTQKHKQYSFLERGSDERQYCSPMVNLPMVTLMRSKFGTFKEYHTSLDDLNLVTPKGLAGSLNLITTCTYLIENDITFLPKFPCEPNLGKRGMYPLVSTKDTRQTVKNMMNVLAYCDGQNSLLDIAEIIDVEFSECKQICDELFSHNLLSKA